MRCCYLYGKVFKWKREKIIINKLMGTNAIQNVISFNARGFHVWGKAPNSSFRSTAGRTSDLQGRILSKNSGIVIPTWMWRKPNRYRVYVHVARDRRFSNVFSVHLYSRRKRVSIYNYILKIDQITGEHGFSTKKTIDQQLSRNVRC